MTGQSPAPGWPPSGPRVRPSIRPRQGLPPPYQYGGLPYGGPPRTTAVGPTVVARTRAPGRLGRRRDPSPARRAAGPRRRRRRGRIVVLLVLVAVAVAVIAAGLRYIPLIDEVRSVREASVRLADEARALEPADLDRASVERIRSGLDDLDERLVPVRAVLDEDLLVDLARRVPGAAVQVQAADDLLEAADSLVEAGHIGLGLADQVVSLREADAADPAFALLPGLVELVATSGADVDRAAELLAAAGSKLDDIPDEALGEIREARDLAADPIASYATLLDSYRELDDVLPGLLGWGDEKRYLVLAQNPAELRPTGGYTGTIGTVVLRDGAIVEQRFEDTYFLSVQEGLPFVEPPRALADFLLGDDQSWRLADANWSPDFPTSARKAAEFYQIETGEGPVDGVIAITTYALDRILEVTGSVEVPEYGVTVQPGDVTLTLLGATRGTPSSIEGRKDVLDALARQTTDRLLSLPPERWDDTVAALDDVRERGDALVWLADEDAQQLVEEAGWDGRVRQDPRRLRLRRRGQRRAHLEVQLRHRPHRSAHRHAGRGRQCAEPAPPGLAEQGWRRGRAVRIAARVLHQPEWLVRHVSPSPGTCRQQARGSQGTGLRPGPRCRARGARSRPGGLLQRPAHPAGRGQADVPLEGPGRRRSDRRRLALSAGGPEAAGRAPHVALGRGGPARGAVVSEASEGAVVDGQQVRLRDRDVERRRAAHPLRPARTPLADDRVTPLQVLLQRDLPRP